MVKLLLKDYTIRTAEKDCNCNYCDKVIDEGVKYREFNDEITLHKLHEFCYLEISIKGIKQTAQSIEDSNNKALEDLEE